MRKVALLFMSVLAPLAMAQVHGPPAGIASHGTVGIPVDPRILLPLTDFWLADDQAKLSRDNLGFIPVLHDGDMTGNWKSEIMGLPLAADQFGDGGPWRTGKFGGRSAVAFSGDYGSGLVGAFPITFTDGATVIVLGRLTGSIPWRHIVSASADRTTNPGDEDLNGFALETRETGSRMSWAHYADHAYVGGIITSDVELDTPGMWVASIDQSIPLPSHVAGLTDGSSVMTLGVSGGPPQSVWAPTDQSPISPKFLSIGCGTSTYWGAPVDISAVFICNRRVTPEELQKFYDQWVTPYYGYGVFTERPFTPRHGPTRGNLRGAGLNVGFSKVPLDDFKNSFHFQWARIALPPAPTDAAIDELIDYYLGNGIWVDWLLPSTVTSGSPPTYDSVVALAQQVCRRMTAKGYGRPFFELGNECIQLHIPPLSTDFPDEYAAETAYAVWNNSFMLGMAGYDYLVCGCNDEPIYTWRAEVATMLGGGKLPDLWGIHTYSTSDGTAGANMPGTQLVLQEWMASSVVNTEGGFAAPYATETQCVNYFTHTYANMGDLPWCYYTAGSSTWNTGTDGYGLYRDQSWDTEGVSTWSNHTPTATAIAISMGWALPTG